MLNVTRTMSLGQKRVLLLAFDALTVLFALVLAFSVLQVSFEDGSQLTGYLAISPYAIAVAIAGSYFFGFAEVPMRSHELSFTGQVAILASGLALASFSVSA